MPQRLYRKHLRERMPPGSRGVVRPSRWGNRHDWRTLGRAEAVRRYAEDLARMPAAERSAWLAPLRAKDLWCYCPLDQPCHVDVLLYWANVEPVG